MIKIDETTSRSLRQLEALKKWKEAGGRATLVLPTGFGKSFTTMRLVLKFREQNPDFRVIVVVPTLDLKEQWELGWTNVFQSFDNFTCMVINTACTAKVACDLLVIDEVHGALAPQFRQVFSSITYTLFLGLTATIERLDGKEALLLRSFPIADIISREDAIANGWLSNYTEYKVLLSMPDRKEYDAANAEFQKWFEYFSRDFNLAMTCVKDFKKRNVYAKLKNTSPKEVLAASASFQRALKARMSYVAEHPKKIEVANRIISCMKDRKGLVFSYSIDSSSKIAGHQFNSKLTPTQRKKSLEVFNQLDHGFLSSVKALDLGVDVKDLSVAIILHGSSSKIQKAQRLGRIIRLEGGKHSLLFSLVFENTVDDQWYTNANNGADVVFIDEEELFKMLEGKDYKCRKAINKPVFCKY